MSTAPLRGRIDGPTLRDYIREAGGLVRRERILTSTVGLVVLGMVIGILTSAGQSDAAASSILGRLDTPAARSIVVSDPNAQGALSGRSVQVIRALSDVDWALGLGSAQDVRNALVPSGDPVPLRTVSGDIELALGLDPEELRPGAVLASRAGAQRLGFAQGVGAAVSSDQAEHVITSTYEPPEWLTQLRESVIVRGADESSTVAFVVVLATSITVVPQLIDAIRAVLVADDPSQISVTGSAILADLSAVVSSDLATYSQTIVLGVLGLGAFATIVAVLGVLGMRSADFGRRRALGASRSQLVGLTLLHVTFAAAIGAAAGTAMALVGLQVAVGQLPTFGFTLGSLVLAILASIVATAPPVLRAAARDPVDVLRTP